MDSTNLYQHQLIQQQLAAYPFLTGISTTHDWDPSMTSEEEYSYYKGKEELRERSIGTYSSSIKSPILHDGHQINYSYMNCLNDNSLKEQYDFDLNENILSNEVYRNRSKTCNGLFGGFSAAATSNYISSPEYSNFQDPKFSFSGITYNNSGDSITGLHELIHCPSNKKKPVVSNIIGESSKAKRTNYSAEITSQEASKKPRVTSHSSTPILKVQKEKLGDRISALHRLVAPFGKTDRASVLTEAIGYIQFLQHQILTLSMPYTKSSHGKLHQINLKDWCTDMKGPPMLDLKSRGLCLVPISLSSYITT